MTPETTSVNNHSDESAAAKKPRRQEKPRFEKFITDLQGRISNSIGKDQFADIYRALRKGFQEPIALEHLNQIILNLIAWRDFSRLAVKLTTEIAVGRPSALMKRLLPQIRLECGKRSSFPGDEIASVGSKRDSTYWQRIRSWVKSRFQVDPVTDDLARNAFVCVISEMIGFEEFCSIQVLLAEADAKAKATRKGKKRRPGKKINGFSEYKSYTRQIGAYLSAKKLVLTKTSLSLTVYEILTERSRKLESRIEGLDQQLSRERAVGREYKDRLDASDKERRVAGEEIAELKGRLSLVQQELEKEKERFNGLDEHWTRRLERELKGQAYDLSKVLGHEVREMAMSLDRENPNPEMALGRVRNMEAYLKKMGENQ